MITTQREVIQDGTRATEATEMTTAIRTTEVIIGDMRVHMAEVNGTVVGTHQEEKAGIIHHQKKEHQPSDETKLDKAQQSTSLHRKSQVHQQDRKFNWRESSTRITQDVLEV